MNDSTSKKSKQDDSDILSKYIDQSGVDEWDLRRLFGDDPPRKAKKAPPPERRKKPTGTLDEQDRKLCQRLRPGHRVVHGRLGVCVYQAEMNGHRHKVKDADGESHTVSADELRPLDERDWEDQKSAEAFAELSAAGNFCISYDDLDFLDINPRAMRMLEKMASWQRTHGNAEWFYMVDAELMRQLGVDLTTVKRLRRELAEPKKRGYLEVRANKSQGGRGGGHVLEYRIVWAKIKKDADRRRKEWDQKHPELAR